MGYVSTGMGDRFGALLLSLMVLGLTLVDLVALLTFYALAKIRLSMFGAKVI